MDKCASSFVQSTCVCWMELLRAFMNTMSYSCFNCAIHVAAMFHVSILCQCVIEMTKEVIE
jgi:hypothetical protein